MQIDIDQSLQAIKKGGIILYPTDTIWGIGCDATNSEAVKKIYEVKQREDSKSMLVLLSDINKLSMYVDVPEIAWDILEMTETPLTIIYPNARNLAPELIASDGTVGIRIVKDEFCSKLLYQLKRPLVSTSANISGQPSPNNFREISKLIKSSVNYVVKWKQQEPSNSVASGIIKLGMKGEISVIREYKNKN